MIAIREGTPADAHGIASVQVRGWHTTYKGNVPDEFLNKMSIDVQEKRLKRDSLLMKENNISLQQKIRVKRSQVTSLVEKIEYPDINGELYAIYILETAQYEGLGQRLVYTLVEWLKENDFSYMLVWVLADNSAKLFYQKLGAGYLGRKKIKISGKLLEENVYMWRSFDSFDQTCYKRNSN